MIKYQGVTIEREDQTLFSNIDLRVREGEFVYLIGKVGAGKSSLLKTLYAELPITEGKARIFEYDLANIKRSQIPYLRRQLGIIFQDFQLLTDRTIKENLDFVLKATGWKSKHEREDRISEVLKLVDLENKAWRMPNTLSGGEQQRVVIARALLNKPSLILADEPTGNLDPETGKNIVALLHEISKSQNTAVIMSTHNMQFLESFPGTVIKAEDEKLVTLSTIDETPSLEENDEENASVEDYKNSEDTKDTEENISEEPENNPTAEENKEDEPKLSAEGLKTTETEPNVSEDSSDVNQAQDTLGTSEETQTAQFQD